MQPEGESAASLRLLTKQISVQTVQLKVPKLRPTLRPPPTWTFNELLLRQALVGALAPQPRPLAIQQFQFSNTQITKLC